MKPTAKKIKILKIEPLEPDAHAPLENQRHRVELEVEGAPIPLPEHPLTLPIEVVEQEFRRVEGSAVIDANQAEPADDVIPEEKKGIINWLKSFWV